jgi:hypothetical protein
MKRFVFIGIVLVFISLFLGCATSSEERKETYDLRNNVGSRPFVGLPSVSASDNWRSP